MNRKVMAENIEHYLRERDDIGKVIIHDLIGPIYNLLNLSREIRCSAAGHQVVDSPSAEIAVEITERLLNKVLNLYALAFDNKKLFVVSVFDVGEMIGNVVKTNEPHFRSIRVQPGRDHCYFAGDADVTQIWFDQALTLIHERFGREQDILICLTESEEDVTICIRIEGTLTTMQRADQFMDKVVAIDKLSTLLNASVTLEEASTFMNMILKINSYKTVSS